MSLKEQLMHEDDIAPSQGDLNLQDTDNPVL